MITKLFEIRCLATSIRALATQIDAGFYNVGDPSVRRIFLCRIFRGRGEGYDDPHSWMGRTLTAAHEYIVKNWNQMKDGDVIDVEFILGETKVKAAAPKITYVTRCPACHAKIEWVEYEVTAKTTAELAAENALCNAAYLAKKTE